MTGLPVRRMISAVLVTVLLAMTAAWISLGRLHHLQHADSLVMVLVSLQRWTFFVWEQDRFGMLVPLLAMPIRHPLANMIVQAALNTLAALATGFLLVRYLLGPALFWMAAAALANIWFLLLIPERSQFEWFVGLPQYGIGLTVGLVALLALEKKRTLAALVCMLLAHWINPAVFLLLLPLAVMRHLFDRAPPPPRLIDSLLVIAVGVLGGWLLMRAAPHRTAYQGVDLPPQWVHGWLSLADMTRRHVLPDPLRLMWILAPAASGLLLLRRPGSRRVLLVAAGLAATALLYALLMGTLSWVRMNMYAPRYLAPSLLLMAMAMAIVAIAPFETHGRRGRVVALAATALMIVAAGLAYGRPSLGGVERAVDQHFGRLTPDILASGASVVAGNYSVVWPAVFHANLALYQRGEHRTVYGLSFRAMPTLPLWAARTERLCIAVPLHDGEAAQFIARAGVRVTHDRYYSTIETLCR